MRLRSTAWAYMSLFRIKAAEGLQYRLSGISSASVGVVWALIEIVVYTVFYTYSEKISQDGVINGLTLSQVVTYAWIGQIFVPLQPMGVDSDILDKIVSGDVGIELCRPLDLYSLWFSKSAAGKTARFWTRGVVIIFVSMILPSSIGISAPSSFAGFILFIVSMFSAFLLCSSYGMLVNVIRLGITWGEGPIYMLTLLGMVMSGAYLPLQLWPDFMQGFLLIQPFAGYLDIPVRLYIGSMSITAAVPSVLLQLIWIVIFVVIGKLLLAHKLKKLIVQGG